jgi:hypothetical protein
MKPRQLAVALAVLALTGLNLAHAQGSNAQAQAAADEAAGLPDLTKINRPAAEVSSKVDVNDVPRTPSFHTEGRSGTEVTEYRDRGKPVEIDVKSSFGTRYQMTSPLDNSPQPRDPSAPVKRLPSINLSY